MNETIAFSATSTLQDVLDANRLLARANTPKTKLARWRRPLFVGACVFVGLAIGVLSGDGDKIDFLKTVFTTRLGVQFLVFLATLALLWWLGGLAMRAWVKIVTRSAYADSRRKHPAVDHRDPSLPMTRRYTFDETGMATSTSADELWESWRRITGIEETERLLVVTVGKSAAYPIPRNALTPDRQDELIQYVSSRMTSKWPF